MSFNSKYLTFGKSCKVSDEMPLPVHNDLAITPAKMSELVEQGIPVSSAVLSMQGNDGVANPDWDLPIDLRRGVDIASVWDAQKSARNNITNKVVVKE